MKYKLSICAIRQKSSELLSFLWIASVLLLCSTWNMLASAQVASHAPTAMAQPVVRPGTPAPAMVITGKPVARVNDTVLTDRDLQREMFSIFPYARQHNGAIPQEMEPQIRQGAMQMIIFEELVYQEAQRRRITVSPERLSRAEADFRKQFPSPAEYNSFVQVEFHGSQPAVNEKIRRSLLIETLLKSDVDNKSKITVAEAKAYYDQNPTIFQYPEAFAFQTISILPPDKATPAQLKEARKKAEDALKQAKATKNYEEFGILAEKISEDDYRVMMGDHHKVDRSKLPPDIVKSMLTMQPGQITDLIQIENAYTIVRLIQHVPAGKVKFEDVRVQLMKQLQDRKTNEVRAAFDKKLRQNAKVEVL